MKKNLFLAVAMLLTTATFAQFGLGGAMGTQIVVPKTKIVSGDPSAVKGKKVKVELTFDGMVVSKYKVGFGKRISEQDFIKNKSEDINKKDPGKGDEWASKWNADKNGRYLPSFIEKYNEMGKETNSLAGTDDAELTLVVHTSYTEPGYFIGIDKTPAIINAEMEFKDKSGNSVLSVSTVNCPGQAFGFGDIDTGSRMAEAYEKLAKELVAIMKKKWK